MVSSPFSFTSCKTYTSVLLLTANALKAVRVMCSAAWATGTRHNHTMRPQEAKTKPTLILTSHGLESPVGGDVLLPLLLALKLHWSKHLSSLVSLPHLLTHNLIHPGLWG